MPSTSANQKPSMHTHSQYIQDNQKPLKVVAIHLKIMHPSWTIRVRMV